MEQARELGYPINTVDEEGSFAVSADGLTAYYASDRGDTHGDLDLYKFKLRDDIRPYRTLYVKGKVLDKKTNKGLPSTVELIDNSNSNPLMKIQTDEWVNTLLHCLLERLYILCKQERLPILYGTL